MGNSGCVAVTILPTFQLNREIVVSHIQRKDCSKSRQISFRKTCIATDNPPPHHLHLEVKKAEQREGRNKDFVVGGRPTMHFKVLYKGNGWGACSEICRGKLVLIFFSKLHRR